MVFDPDKFLKVAVGLGILTAGVGVGYHYGIYLPQSERQKIERSEKVAREQQQTTSVRETEQKDRYNSCLELAEKSFSDGWARDCKVNGQNNRGPNCNLPASSAEYWNKISKDDREQCLAEFKLGI